MDPIKNETYEELVPLVDSVFQIMEPSKDKPINVTKVVFLLHEIFGLNLFQHIQIITPFIRSRWKGFIDYPIVRIQREHMNQREDNFLWNLKGNYAENKQGQVTVAIIEKQGEGETDVSSDLASSSKNVKPVKVVKKSANAEIKVVEKHASKTPYKKIKRTKLIYKTNDYVYAVTGKKSGTRKEVFDAIRQYIKDNDLKSKDPDNPDKIKCDRKLSQILGDEFTFSQLGKLSMRRLLQYRFGQQEKDIEVVVLGEVDKNEGAGIRNNEEKAGVLTNS